MARIAAIAWVPLLAACAPRATGSDRPPVDSGEEPVDTAGDPTTEPPDDGPFVPAWLSLDAHFGVDLAGHLAPVYDAFYTEAIDPQLVVYIGSEAWEPGDWDDAAHLCTVSVSAAEAVLSPELAEEQGLWFAFGTGIVPEELDDGCEPLEGPDFDAGRLVAGLTWTVGIGPLREDLVPEFAGDPRYVGGYVDLANDYSDPGDVPFQTVVSADVVDPYTMLLEFDVEDDYAWYVPVEDAASLATGDARGVAPAWYHVVSYGVIPRPAP